MASKADVAAITAAVIAAMGEQEAAQKVAADKGKIGRKSSRSTQRAATPRASSARKGKGKTAATTTREYDAPTKAKRKEEASNRQLWRLNHEGILSDVIEANPDEMPLLYGTCYDVIAGL